MCFHASRFEARKSVEGKFVPYNDQDERLWNRELISQGVFYLHKSSQGDSISRYHLEAGIAYWHTLNADTPKKWENILQLYNYLLAIDYSPLAALNRTYAIAKVCGTEVAIAEAEKLSLSDNHYYHTLLGDLYKTINKAKAKEHLMQALKFARSETDKKTIFAKLAEL